jgi:hypothetical protein
VHGLDFPPRSANMQAGANRICQRIVPTTRTPALSRLHNIEFGMIAFGVGKE